MLAWGLLWTMAAPVASAQIYALPRADTTADTAFGADVAIDGDVALVGASGENECGPNSGAAYIYQRGETPGAWTQAARLTPSRCDEGAFFGRALDLSGGRAIVSASSEFFAARQSNAAYIFARDSSGAWTEQARLIAETDYNEGAFAASVAIDGNQALVTTSGSSDGDYGGAAYFYAFDESTGEWELTSRLTAAAGVQYGVLGGTSALDGDRAAVAASTYFEKKPGSVYLFERTADGTWRETARVGGIDDFFISLDLSGSRLLVGEARGGRKESGRATLYERQSAETWTQVTELQPATPYESGAFGSAVSLSGDRALVTGYDEQLGQDYNIDRVVYTFRYNEANDAWPQQQIIDLGKVAFGAAVDHDGEFAIISSVPEDEPGSVYIVQLF
jgi:hypothetical protein